MTREIDHLRQRMQMVGNQSKKVPSEVEITICRVSQKEYCNSDRSAQAQERQSDQTTWKASSTSKPAQHSEWGVISTNHFPCKLTHTDSECMSCEILLPCGTASCHDDKSDVEVVWPFVSC